MSHELGFALGFVAAWGLDRLVTRLEKVGARMSADLNARTSRKVFKILENGPELNVVLENGEVWMLTSEPGEWVLVADEPGRERRGS